MISRSKIQWNKQDALLLDEYRTRLNDSKADSLYKYPDPCFQSVENQGDIQFAHVLKAFSLATAGHLNHNTRPIRDQTQLTTIVRH